MQNDNVQQQIDDLKGQVADLTTQLGLLRDEIARRLPTDLMTQVMLAHANISTVAQATGAVLPD